MFYPHSRNRAMREPGFYWVRQKDETDWYIAEYFKTPGGHYIWQGCGDDEEYDDSHFYEIDERRIVREEQCKDNELKDARFLVFKNVDEYNKFIEEHIA
jgi:hypothetical protein